MGNQQETKLLFFNIRFSSSASSKRNELIGVGSSETTREASYKLYEEEIVQSIKKFIVKRPLVLLNIKII